MAAGDVGRGYTTIDSGIALIALQGSRTSIADRNVIEAQLSYVGVLREIIELVYNTTPVVIFRGNWIPLDENGNISIKRNQYGFWLANFNRRQRTNVQPYAFPSHVKQVFFADDPHDPSWKVVLHKGTRNTRVVGADESAVLGVGVVDEAPQFLHGRD